MSNQLQENLPKVLVLGPPDSYPLMETHFSHKFHFLKPWESPLPLLQFLSTHAHSVQAIVSSTKGPVTSDVLRCLPSLKLITTTSAGLDHIDLPECRNRGVAVANAANTFSEDVADLAVGLLIDVLRKVSAADRYVRNGCWSVKGDFDLGSKLTGKSVGIVGLGSIGSEVAKRLEAFGCSISYNSTKKKLSFSYPFYTDVCELAANCDILIICCALTDQTHHMIGKEVMLALGKNGVIINVARGAIIDEKEMVRCLVRGEIGGAGLDVFENEPSVPRELFDLDNVVLGHHNGACTSESLMDICKRVVANLDAAFSNKPLISPYMNY